MEAGRPDGMTTDASQPAPSRGAGAHTHGSEPEPVASQEQCSPCPETQDEPHATPRATPIVGGCCSAMPMDTPTALADAALGELSSAAPPTEPPASLVHAVIHEERATAAGAAPTRPSAPVLSLVRL